MKSSVVGFQKLFALAEEVLDIGLPLDVIDTDIGESPVIRTDKTVIDTLLRAYGNGDLVLPLGKLEDGSSLVALEVDKNKGGEETFQKLWKNCPIPRTVVVQTEEGCAYVLMRHSGDARIDRVDLGDGLAMIANANYIIVPPFDGGGEAWWKNFPGSMDELAVLPEKLAGLL